MNQDVQMPSDPTVTTGRIYGSCVEKVADAAVDAVVAYALAVDQMLAHEQAGGNGWWKGWEMLKAAHRKAGYNVD